MGRTWKQTHCALGLEALWCFRNSMPLAELVLESHLHVTLRIRVDEVSSGRVKDLGGIAQI